VAGDGGLRQGSKTDHRLLITASRFTEVKTAWDKARERVKLPGLLRHDLRRTAIRNMVRAGIPEKRAMLISGHKNRNVFDRYDINDERDIQGDGEKLTAYLP
jgi:integrase